MNTLRWAEDVLVGKSIRCYQDWLRYLAGMARRIGVPAPRPEETLDAPSAIAHVLQGDWIARCPWCLGEEGIWRTDPRFYCASCGNGAVAGRLVRVEFAQSPDEVEMLLAGRPEKAKRGWLPRESLGYLRAENQERGLLE